MKIYKVAKITGIKKIYRTAAVDTSIPEGHVLIEIVIENGEKTTRIAGHGPKTKCSKEDVKMLHDLDSVEVQGYYGSGGIDAEGKTKEFYQEQKKAQEAAQNNAPAEKAKQTKQPQRTLDVGGIGV